MQNAPINSGVILHCSLVHIDSAQPFQAAPRCCHTQHCIPTNRFCPRE